MNIFALSGLINAISIFALGSFVYFKNKKNQLAMSVTVTIRFKDVLGQVK